MRNTLSILAGFIALFTACSTAPRQQSANREDRRVAFVRVVNAMPAGPSLDIFAGDQKLFSSVKPGAVIAYREVSRGLTTFRARPVGQDFDTPLADNMEILREGKYATILLRPGKDGTKVDMSVLKDYVWEPSAGKAKVRVVHTIPGMSGIDVYSQGKKLLGGVDFTDESRYVELDPMTGDFELRRADNQQVIATVSKLRLDADKAYTVLLAGSSEKPLTITLEDRTEKYVMPEPHPFSS